jgi:hypothetical protein
MKFFKLNWEKKYSADKSCFWYSTKVPGLNWEYIIDDYDDGNVCFLSTSPNQDEARIFKNKKLKTIESAQEECQKHLLKTYKNFEKWIQSRSYEK